MGHPQIKTPNLDALASRGVLLRNLFIQSAVCMPSRASILTGRYPSTHGVVSNGYDLPDSERTIAHMFSDAGYFTGCVGRTHVTCSLPHPVLPEVGYRGFEEGHHSQCYWEGLDPHGAYLQWIKQYHPDLYDEAATPVPVNRDDAFCSSWTTLDDSLSMTAWVTDQSLKVLKNHADREDDRPFFLWAGTWDPHARFLTPPPWDRMYPPEDIPLPVLRDGELDQLLPHFRQSAKLESPNPDLPLDEVIRNTLSIYWGMISHIDDQFGRLIHGCDELGLLDNTIVLFLSDHGELGGDHGLWGKGPWFYDSALRVPGILAAPGRLPAGRSTDALVETVDLLPTLLDLAGVNPPGPSGIQGRSCRNLLDGKAETHRESAFTEYQDYDICEDRLLSIRTDRYRFTCYQNAQSGELFDLQQDPDALFNQWDSPEYARVKLELRESLLQRSWESQARPDTRTAKW